MRLNSMWLVSHEAGHSRYASGWPSAHSTPKPMTCTSQLRHVFLRETLIYSHRRRTIFGVDGLKMQMTDVSLACRMTRSRN
jgi:hypothetical protein